MMKFISCRGYSNCGHLHRRHKSVMTRWCHFLNIGTWLEPDEFEFRERLVKRNVLIVFWRKPRFRDSYSWCCTYAEPRYIVRCDKQTINKRINEWINDCSPSICKAKHKVSAVLTIIVTTDRLDVENFISLTAQSD